MQRHLNCLRFSMRIWKTSSSTNREILICLKYQILKFKREPKESNYLLKTGPEERCCRLCRLMKPAPTYAMDHQLESRFWMSAKIAYLKCSERTKRLDLYKFVYSKGSLWCLWIIKALIISQRRHPRWQNWTQQSSAQRFEPTVSFCLADVSPSQKQEIKAEICSTKNRALNLRHSSCKRSLTGRKKLYCIQVKGKSIVTFSRMNALRQSKTLLPTQKMVTTTTRSSTESLRVLWCKLVIPTVMVLAVNPFGVRNSLTKYTHDLTMMYRSRCRWPTVAQILTRHSSSSQQFHVLGSTASTPFLGALPKVQVLLQTLNQWEWTRKASRCLMWSCTQLE